MKIVCIKFQNAIEVIGEILEENEELLTISKVRNVMGLVINGKYEVQFYPFNYCNINTDIPIYWDSILTMYPPTEEMVDLYKRNIIGDNVSAIFGEIK